MKDNTAQCCNGKSKTILNIYKLSANGNLRRMYGVGEEEMYRSTEWHRGSEMNCGGKKMGNKLLCLLLRD